MVEIGFLGGGLARAAEELFGPADRVADARRDLEHAPPARAEQEDAPLQARQCAQHAAHLHRRVVRRLERPLRHGRVAIDAQLAAPPAPAGVAHRGDQPAALVRDRSARAEEAQEDLVHERLRLVLGHAELLLGHPAKQRRQQDVPLFRRHCYGVAPEARNPHPRYHCSPDI